MGTRADFYVGRGKEAEWLGSIAWDGYPDGIDLRSAEREQVLPGVSLPKRIPWPQGEHLFDSKTEAEFRERVALFFKNRDDVTLPERGWPWPWETSHVTDYAYAFDGGVVYGACFGHSLFIANEPEPDDDSTGKACEFPDMTQRQNVQIGGSRSGLIVVTSQR